MRSGLLAVVISLVVTSCVDGKTPDCSTPQSGCFPQDGSSGGDGGGDGSASDGSTSDAGDAQTQDVVTDGSLLDVLTD